MANFWARLTSLPASYLALWAALAVLTAGLVVLMRTRWGRERPTHRYVLLSVVGHLLLICLATTVRFLSAPVGEPASAPIKIRIAMRAPAAATQPEPVVAPEPPAPVVTEPDREEPITEQAAAEPTESEPSPPIEPTLEEPLNAESSDPADEASADPTPEIAEPAPKPIEAPPVETIETTEQVAPIESFVTETASEPTSPAPAPVEPAPIEPTPVESSPVNPALTVASAPTPIFPTSPAPIEAAPWQPGPSQPGTTLPVAVLPDPTPYGARTELERLRIVEREGGSSATEDAVAAALAWLAAAQSNDGRWDADRWSAGRERRVLGEDRRSAGVRADTGVTGLALLALMGAGHTHADDGPYAETVRAGLEYLMRTQTSDGGLADDATLFAQTYCHSMATFALAEALAHTRDDRLERVVRRAVDHLIARQHPATGGWRYRPGQPGDMSQIGWVIMALRSAELGGVEIPPATWAGIERFVASVQRGQQGGLACYRRDGPVSRTMTAEALYCRQILGAPIAGPSRDEAINALLGGPPGSGHTNLYFWYYATLALHHNRHANGYADTAWRAWNDALTRSLVSSQVRDGSNAGSWSPNTLWGGYGGRVYSTAMAAMCLEVYYRYDPQELIRDPWIAARPGRGTLR